MVYEIDKIFIRDNVRILILGPTGYVMDTKRIFVLVSLRTSKRGCTHGRITNELFMIQVNCMCANVSWLFGSQRVSRFFVPTA